MTKQDMKYRNRVLRGHAGKQAKDVHEAIVKKVIIPLIRELKRDDHLNKTTVLSAIQYVVNGSGVEEKVTQIRKKKDITKLIGIKYLNELKRLKKKYS